MVYPPYYIYSCLALVANPLKCVSRLIKGKNGGNCKDERFQFTGHSTITVPFKIMISAWTKEADIDL